ncbi:MAG TPA: hypothetical protein PK628_04860 [Chitinophagales bacterium]|mgnify:CR=1 FL=1|nr:hypothetical protein [Chitinophagales bacterium]HNG71917.1 hypothetical protein [Chitinophagales bacterium]HNI32240.1 hypothetical protein [Chitinophagales bacterium]
MNPNYNQIEFKEYERRMMAVLAKMKIDLDEYKKKENANAAYIQRNENILKHLLEYVAEIVPEYIEILEQQNKNSYRAGYNAGAADAEKKYTWKPDMQDKENFRTYWTLEQNKILPNLY